MRGVPSAESYDDEMSIASRTSDCSGAVAGVGSHVSERTPVSIVGIEVKRQGRSVHEEDGPASAPTPKPSNENDD